MFRKSKDSKIYCPVNGWDCPYYRAGLCTIDDPWWDCDDFAVFWDEDDDYEVFDDEEEEEDP